MRSANVQRNLRAISAAMAVLGVVGIVHAQDAGPITSANETEMELGPGNLPGREKSDRERPKTPTPEEKAKEAEKKPEPREWFVDGGKPWLEWARVTGDWGGVRTSLEDVGLTINGSLTLDWSSVWSGGIRKYASSRSLIDVNATLDTEKAFGLPGGSLYADFYSSDGRGGSEDAGDYSGVSNIFTGINVHQLAELWYQQWFFDKKLRVKVGKSDANSDFALFNSTGDFLNGPSANPATLYPVFPTYPNPSTGICAFVFPTEEWYVGGGYYDGSLAEGKPTGRLGPKRFFSGPDYFWIGETGLSWKDCAGLGKGRAAVGAWRSTADFAAFDGSTKDGMNGFYLMGEQQIAKRDGAGPDDNKGVFLFGEYGWGDKNANPVANHIGFGVSCLGTFPGRDSDSCGFMANWLQFSHATGSPFEGSEWSFEWYYKLQVTPAISVSPDLQFITNPSGNPQTSDAVVGQLRVIIAF